MSRFDDIRVWGFEKGILTNSKVNQQFLKLAEEVGELANGIAKEDLPEIEDAIGDCVVVLTLLAEMSGLKIEDCIDSAYNVIKKRNGSIINGNFVKND
jgi:NTP pyrophosphatase (non-canonical NTP hydrolase)